MKKHRTQIYLPLVGIVLSILLFLFVSACTPAVIAVNEASTGAQVFAPLSFKDTVGNEVNISEQPERIISLAPSVTEWLYAIDVGDLMVGRTEFCNYPEEAVELPTVGGFSASSISTETIISLEPDLVIGGSIYQTEVINALNDAGMNAFILEPNSIDEIFDTLILLGQVTASLENAEHVVENMRSRIDAVQAIVETISPEEHVTVFYEVWNDPYMTATDQTFIGELINMAGGVNIFGGLQEEYPSISAEEIIEKDPLVILGPSDHGDQLLVEIIAGREGWQNLSAVKNKRIYIINGDIVSRATPRVVDALEDIAHSLYPDYF